MACVARACRLPPFLFSSGELDLQKHHQDTNSYQESNQSVSSRPAPASVVCFHHCKCSIYVVLAAHEQRLLPPCTSWMTGDRRGLPKPFGFRKNEGISPPWNKFIFLSIKDQATVLACCWCEAWGKDVSGLTGRLWMTDNISAVPVLSTFGSFLLMPYLKKVSWPFPCKKRLQPGSLSDGRWSSSFPAVFSPYLSSGAHCINLSDHHRGCRWCEEFFLSDFMPCTTCFSGYRLACLATALPLACQSSWSLLSLFGYIFMMLEQRGN